MHMLLTLDENEVRICPELVENLIDAEIPPLPPANILTPEANQARKLRELVIKHQMHTCSDTYCLMNIKDDGRCEKDFPRDYSRETHLGERNTIYKRLSPEEGGEQINIAIGSRQVQDDDTLEQSNSLPVGNEMCVERSNFVLLMTESHNNLQWVGNNPHALEYTLKYILKGEFPIGLDFHI